MATIIKPEERKFEEKWDVLISNQNKNEKNE
jgi:hypothetical protein